MILGWIDKNILLWLFLLPVLFVFLYWRFKARIRILKEFRLKSLPLNLLTIIPLFIAFLLTLALARPHSGFEEFKVPAVGRDVMVVMDISRSMSAADIKPSRFTRAVRKLSDLVSYIQNKQAGDRIGITLFAGESYLFCPLTSDYNVVQQFVQSIKPGLISSTGSAISEAISGALKSLKEVEAIVPTILLFSDGEEDRIQLERIVNEANESSVPIHTFGFGTSAGIPLLQRPGKYLKDSQGNMVVSRLNEESLSEISNRTGGTYQKAAINDSDIIGIFSDSEVLMQKGFKEGEETVRIYKELGPIFVFITLIFILCVFLFRMPRAVLPCLLLFVPGLSHADGKRSLHDAYRAYKSENYEAAAPTFEFYHSQDGSDVDISQALGSSFYKLEKFKEAHSIFSKQIEASKTGRDKFNGLYNRGNSSFKLEDYSAAIKDYEQALSIKPDDIRAKENLELAKKKLEEQQKQPPPSPQPDNQQQQQQDQDKENQDKSKQGQDKGSEEKEDDKEESEEQQEDEGAQSQEEQSSQDSEPQQQLEHDPKALKEQEAQAWLESLPDSPLLLRKKIGKPKTNNNQTW